MESTDSTRPEFWDSRYEAGQTPWDFHGVPAELTAFLRRTKPGTVLIPGCGTSYEVNAFCQAGWKVCALDFSTAAVHRAKQMLGARGDAVILGNFFTYDFGRQSFDIIYERTFLCALPPALWPDYAKRVTELLRPAGRLVGLFVHGEEPDPPPYLLPEGKAEELFGPNFFLARNDPVFDSLPIFAGKERWQEWEKKT